LNEKFDLYQQVGVKEYWVVHPKEQTVLVYVLEKGIYSLRKNKPFTNTDTIRSTIFPELTIDLAEVFEA